MVLLFVVCCCYCFFVVVVGSLFVVSVSIIVACYNNVGRCVIGFLLQCWFFAVCCSGLAEGTAVSSSYDHSSLLT